MDHSINRVTEALSVLRLLDQIHLFRPRSELSLGCPIPLLSQGNENPLEFKKLHSASCKYGRKRFLCAEA